MPNVTAPTYRSGAESVPASDAGATREARATALAFLQKLATEVSKGSVDLPCFPDVVVRISHALADPTTTSDRGKLYIMARAAGASDGLGGEQSWMDLISGWQASIGKAVLQSWGFADEVCDAVGDQDDTARRRKHAAGLVDVLIASLLLADARGTPEPKNIAIEGFNAFLTIGVAPPDCSAILARADAEIRLIHEALA